MPQYRCTVADAEGRERDIVRQASSAEEAARGFSTGELFLLSLEPLAERPSAARGAGVSGTLVREFTDMTALLLGSGLGLREALAIVEEIAGGKLKTLVRDFLAEIDKGDGFSAVLDRRPASFSPLYRGMVRIGEKVGSLQTVFPRLASYLSDRKAFRDKVLESLSYPVLVLVAALAGSAAVAFFILPRLQGLFLELGGTGAEDIRKRMLFASALFRGGALVLLAAAGAVAALLAARARGGAAALAVDRAVLGLPLAGRFVKDWETLNFAFAMEILAKGGVPLETALAEAARTSGNAGFRAAVLAAREDLVKGGPLSSALGARREIPSYVARWIQAGERSGQTDKVFSQIRRYFQAEMDRGSSRFTALLEPLLILLVGGIVLFLLASFVLPLFSLYGSLL